MPPKKILVAVLLLSLQALAQNVVIAPSGNQNIVQPPNTSFSANDYAGIRYVVPNYNWQQSSSGTIMTGPNTVTLAPCPAGILVSPSPFQPSTRLWLTGGGGANEAVLVTATTCPLQGSTGGLGTVTFAAAYSHSGYTIGSASAGIQEAINAANFTTAAGFVQNGTVVVPPGSYTVNARITILGNGQSLQGAGATLSCYMNDTCLFIGDDINATLTSDVTVDGLSFQPNVAHNMFPMIEDNGQHSTIRGLRGQGSAGSMFGSMIQVDNDQSATIDGLDANYPPTSGVSWASCTSTFCSTIVRGASSSGNASVISIKNSVINAQCNANGVDMGTGGGFANTLRIADSIVQDYPQFGVRYRATYPNLGLVLDNVYQEVTCANPLFNNLQSQAGVIALGPQVRNTNGAAGAGNFPRFYSCTPVSTCTNTTFYSYWIVGHSTTYGPNGTSVPLLSGTGATDGTVAGGTIYWPQMCQLGSCGTVTYDLLRITSNMPGYSGIVPSGTLPGGVGDNGAVVTLNSGSCSNTVCSFVDTLSHATMPYAVQEPPSPLWNDALAYWPGSFVLTGNAENEGWQYVARLYTDVLPENGTPMISSYPGPGGVPSVYAQDCSADPVVGSPLWMSCLASEPVGISRTNSGPMVLQNGNVGGTFNPSSPMGRIIFEGTGLGVQQDLITLDDSNQGVNLFSTSGFRPQASAADCAISGDGNGGNHGLALRCANTISNYISHLPDGSNWLEQLTTTAKSFKVHNIVLSNGDPVTNPPFTITVPTPAAARTLAITDPGGNASFGLSLGSTTIAGPTSMITAGACGTSTGTIPLITSANNTLIVTPQASLNTYRGMAVDAYISATGMITLEVCNASSGSVTPGPVNFTVRAF